MRKINFTNTNMLDIKQTQIIYFERVSRQIGCETMTAEKQIKYLKNKNSNKLQRMERNQLEENQQKSM